MSRGFLVTILNALADDVLEERHEASALHRFGQSTLVGGREAGAAA